MSDWQAGDLALCVDASPPANKTGAWQMLEAGRIYTVLAVILGGRALQLCGMDYESYPERGLKPYRFRKIRPDKHEACEEEFVTFLDSMKRTVRV